jgi:hypothetical protein
VDEDFKYSLSLICTRTHTSYIGFCVGESLAEHVDGIEKCGTADNLIVNDMSVKVVVMESKKKDVLKKLIQLLMKEDMSDDPHWTSVEKK